ncbi:unnamed protein product [Rhodiola kirilowii]
MVPLLPDGLVSVTGFHFQRGWEAVMDMEIERDIEVSKEENVETDLDEMKRRLKEMEDEAAALQEMQVKVEKEIVGTHLFW